MTLKILPHGRLQEWVAEEQGYFAAEGLEYSFLPGRRLRRPGRAGRVPAPSRPSGPGAAAPTSAARATGPPAPPPGSGPAASSPRPIRWRRAPSWCRPSPRCAGPRTWPGCRWGWATTPAATSPPCRPWRPCSQPDDVSLTFQGPPNDRLDALLDRQVPAATLFGVPLYVAEAFGFRKVLDATFMIGFLVTGPDVTQADVAKYLAALRRAQMDIDLHPESFKHHHLRAVPEKYRHQVDVRTFGTGERIVFLPYTREVFAATQAWTRRVFPALPEAAPYDEAVLT